MRLIVILALCCATSILQAEIHQVFPGIDNPIQAAVDQARDGDTVLIHEGIYSGQAILYGRTLTIGSEFLMDGDTSHIALTVVQAQSIEPDTSSAFVYSYGEEIAGRLVGLTISGRGGTLLENMEVHVGGGIYIYGSAVTVENCSIVDCEAQLGGAVFLSGPTWTQHSKARISNCTVSRNSAELIGGGIYARDCSLWVDQSVFENDFAGGNSGAIFANRTAIQFRESLFQRCEGDPAGILTYESPGMISDCEFEFNYGTDVLGVDLNSDGHVLITRNVFHHNLPQSSSILLSNRSVPVRFIGNIVEGNQAAPIAGTLIAANQTRGEIAFNIFRNNQSGLGVIYAMQRSRVRVHHNTFTGNYMFSPIGSSCVYSVGFSRLPIDSNLFSDNVGPVIYYYLDNPVTLDARNNYWGDPSGPYHPTQNPGGRGDTLLSDSVLFIPWLTEPPDTTMPSAIDDDPRIPLASTWHILELFPNPFNNEIRIIIAGFTRNDFVLRLFNLQGREITVLHRGPLTGGQLSFTAPPELASGVYFVVASDQNFIDTRKAILLK